MTGTRANRLATNRSYPGTKLPFIPGNSAALRWICAINRSCALCAAHSVAKALSAGVLGKVGSWKGACRQVSGGAWLLNAPARARYPGIKKINPSYIFVLSTRTHQVSGVYLGDTCDDAAAPRLCLPLAHLCRQVCGSRHNP